MKYKPVEDSFRQWRVVVEYYPHADERKFQWYWQVVDSGELLDAGHATDAEVAMYEAHQTIERSIVY